MRGGTEQGEFLPWFQPKVLSDLHLDTFAWCGDKEVGVGLVRFREPSLENPLCCFLAVRVLREAALAHGRYRRTLVGSAGLTSSEVGCVCWWYTVRLVRVLSGRLSVFVCTVESCMFQM